MDTSLTDGIFTDTMDIVNHGCSRKIFMSSMTRTGRMMDQSLKWECGRDVRVGTK